MESTRDGWDVVVIGGGAAGLSAALVLGRARRRVAVIDAGQPRNAPAAHVHGFLSRDGMPPADLLSVGRAEVTCGRARRRASSDVSRRRSCPAPPPDRDFEVGVLRGRQLRLEALALQRDDLGPERERAGAGLPAHRRPARSAGDPAALAAPQPRLALARRGRRPSRRRRPARTCERLVHLEHLHALTAGAPGGRGALNRPSCARASPTTGSWWTSRSEPHRPDQGF
jgi:choline dehydrogenase-like flavoprotein